MAAAIRGIVAAIRAPDLTESWRARLRFSRTELLSPPQPTPTIRAGPGSVKLDGTTASTAYIKVQVVTPAVVVQPQPDIMKALEAIIKAARVLVIRDMAQLRWFARN
ncbi:hypothetical protein AWC03_21165 [Mycobacterium europaeum]|nr:hypothetical protein AWC03_21165 [Mycobacterium europaeum]